MARINPWLRARNAASVTQDEAVFATWELPRKYRLTKSKLSRLENNKVVHIHPFAFQELATRYGKTVREIDASVADELDELYALAREYAPRDSNPEPADIGTAANVAA
jgi:hypothetical protein